MPPTDQELERLVERLLPLLERLFLDHRVPEVEAGEMVRSALTRLSYRWDRIKDHEGWLLSTVTKEVRARSSRPAEEPDHA